MPSDARGTRRTVSCCVVTCKVGWAQTDDGWSIGQASRSSNASDQSRVATNKPRCDVVSPVSPGARFVRTPHDLVRDPQLSANAFRLWSLIRARTGEQLQACWESAASLQRYISPPRRSSRTLPNSTPSISTQYKRAQKELLERGLLVTVRRGIGRSSLRWAISPGLHGELELKDLFDRGAIDDQTFADVRSKQSLEEPSGGSTATCVMGSTQPTMKNHREEPGDEDVVTQIMVEVGRSDSGCSHQLRGCDQAAHDGKTGAFR